MTRPERSEAADYWFTYIDQVGPGNILDIFDVQGLDTLTLLQAISDADSLKRPAPDKWSIRQVAGHVNDVERLLVFRAMWFARGFEAPLPSFEPDVAVAASGADARAWSSHVEEFRAVRAATSAFFRHLPGDACLRRGVASGAEFTVRSLAYIAAGHVAHHVRILRSQYLS